MKKNILVTGGNGFIGHHLLNYLLENTDFDIITIYRKNTSRIPQDSRIKLIQADLTKPLNNLDVGELEYIIHMAAETYVDESLKNCIPFVKSNVLSTANLLEWIKVNHPHTKTCLFSTDEVLGPAPLGVYFKEDSPLKPSNPYSATKAAAELLAYSFAHSFNLPIFTVRSMNVFGEDESPEKFIPKTINRIKKGEKIILHGTGKDDVASRHWIYAKDVSDAIFFLLTNAEPNQIYHIAGEEKDVYYISNLIHKIMKGTDLSDEEIEFVDFHKARPGHDKRYSLSMEKLTNMGWKPKYTLEECITRIVNSFCKTGDSFL